MKFSQITKIFILVFIYSSLLIAGGRQPFSYVSPKADSKNVSTLTNIILRASVEVDESTVSSALLNVIGSSSGLHTGEVILSDDQRTLIFNPFKAFHFSESVKVEFLPGMKSKSGLLIDTYSFEFLTEGRENQAVRYNIGGDYFFDSASQSATSINEKAALKNLPAPPLTVDSVNNPVEGHIFMATWDRNNPHQYGNFIFILDKAGTIVDSSRVNGAPFDFKIQPNGLLTYARGDYAGSVPGAEDELWHMVLDNSLAVVDSFQMKNGYLTDFHEFLMLPNGHVMMMSYHNIIYDMSQIVEGGRTDALLVINIIQEQDKDKNVVFEWRNIDYIPIEDSDLDLTGSRINYSTLNAFDVDDDGNILASFRNHSEIMKISRNTGEILWRMGSPRGEFTFIDEKEENSPYYFARQHDIRRLENGNITVFDNGEFHDPKYSRAAEYVIDEENKIATLVSEFKYPSGNIIAAAAGNAQKYSDGGWFTCYGILNPQSPVKRNVVESHSDGSIALEISLPKNVIAYRAVKMPWKEEVNVVSVTKIDLYQGNIYTFNEGDDITGVSINYVALDDQFYVEATITRTPYGPAAPEFFGEIPAISPITIKYEGAAISTHTSEFHIDLDVFPEIKNPAKTLLYHREFPGQGLFLSLPTIYDSTENELIATTSQLGEIVFGETGFGYTANIPIPYAPSDNEKILFSEPLTLKWTGQGFYESFDLQVSTDSAFTSSLVDTTLMSSYMTLENLTNSTRYFWRVRSNLNSTNSDWSELNRFTSASPYLSIETPNGGENWSIESEVIIRWETNISDSIQVDLYNEDEKVITIDQTSASRKAISWKIPNELQEDSLYTISIFNISDSTIIDESDGYFSIIGMVGIADHLTIVPGNYILGQNYPNPFNPSTTIYFQLPRNQKVTIKVFDISGREVASLLNDVKEAGLHSIVFDAAYLPSGLYIYQLITSDFSQSKKMLLLK